MVLISAEQMARRLLGAATWPVMLVVGLSAYSLSAWHTVLLLAAWGEPWPLRITGAVAVDGLAVGSVVALYVTGRQPDVHLDASTPDAPPAVQPDAEPARTPAASVLDGRTRLDGWEWIDPIDRVDASTLDAVRTSGYEIGRVHLPKPPASVRTVNGHDRTPVRTPVAVDDRPDVPDASTSDVWRRYDREVASGTPWTWAALGAELGCTPDAARKRAERRARRA
jgi:hypothetical protein